MKVSGLKRIRLVCQTHSTVLENVGNGRFFESTFEETPLQSDGGWMTLDLSEYACPKHDPDAYEHPERNNMCHCLIEGDDEDVE